MSYPFHKGEHDGMAGFCCAIVLSFIIVDVICEAVSYGIDGVCGPTTDVAIRGFQKANGLEADGVVGPMTFAKLF